RRMVAAVTVAEGLGFDVPEPAAAVVPVLIGNAADACALSDAIFEHGVFCPAIRPPSVPDGTSRLRVTLMATHTDDHLDRTLEAFARVTRTPPALQIDRPKRDANVQCGRGIFVTGTDTGVGKTIVTAAIAANLKNGGMDVAIHKPLQTGTLDGADDASYAGGLAGVPSYTGRALPDPLAPKVAAEEADEVLRFADVTEHLPQHDALVVEGAGGLLVPIDDDHTMADLAHAFALPVVVVARPALGTLNHTALTIEAARARGLDVLGIVISGMPAAPSLAERTNPAEIERMCGVEIVGVIPLLARVDTERGVKPQDFSPDAWLGPELGGSFDRVAFLEGLAARTRA
ncbi:MAG: dethiobiotin synthase, partial [Actinomycetota bacterium]